MAGPCRRLAGAPLFWVPRTAWQAAVHAWAQTRWTVKLLHVHAFAALELALRRLGRPCTAEELVAEAGPWGASRTENGPYTPASLVLGPPSRWEQQRDFVRRQPVELLARVAAAADMTVIETYGDVVLALRRLGLLVVLDGNGPERFVPNPAPPPVWDVLDLTEGERHALVTAALRSDWQAYGADVQHLLRWAPDG